LTVFGDQAGEVALVSRVDLLDVDEGGLAPLFIIDLLHVQALEGQGQRLHSQDVACEG
jgi:hypothetical protein